MDPAKPESQLHDHANQPFAGGTLADPLTVPPRPTQTIKLTQFVAVQIDGMKPINAKLKHALPGVLSIDVEPCGGILTRYRQIWQLRRVEIGDLVSQLGLAPGEQIEISVEKTERRSLEQSREDTTQLEKTDEATSSDREALAVTQTSARANQWSVHGTLSYGIPGSGVSASVDAGYASQASDTVSRTTDHVHDQTRKSATALKTQTKIAVKSTQEWTNKTLYRRTIANPSSTQTLQVWGYEIAKCFRVITASEAAVPALSIRIRPLDFSSTFLATRAGFVRDALFDVDLRESLDDAIIAARQVGPLSDGDKPVDKEELEVLENLVFSDQLGPYLAPPQPSVTESLAEFASIASKISIAQYAKWQEVGAAPLFLQWAALRRLWSAGAEPETADSKARADTWRANRVGLLRAFAASVKANWTEKAAAALQAASATGEPAAIRLARLLQQFVFVTDVILGPSADSAQIDRPARAALQAVLDHLNDHKEHYTARYLQWVERSVGRAFLGRIANAIVDESCVIGTGRLIPHKNLFRLDLLHLSGCDIVVPLDLDASWAASWKAGAGSSIQDTMAIAVLSAEPIALAAAAVEILVDKALMAPTPKDVLQEPVPPALEAPKFVQNWGAASTTAGAPANPETQQAAALGLGANPSQDSNIADSLGGATVPATSPPKYGSQLPGAADPSTLVRVADDVRVLIDGVHLVAGFA